MPFILSANKAATHYATLKGFSYLAVYHAGTGQTSPRNSTPLSL